MDPNSRAGLRPPLAELGIGAALFVATVLARLPFAGQILYHWDSINYALALRRFDVAASQPQMPGYILFVGLLRLVDRAFDDPQRTQVVISAVSSGLAVAVLYFLGRLMWNRFVGALAALLLFSSPLFWFYGAIALPNCLDCFVVLGIVLLLYEIRAGRRLLLVPAAVWLGIAGGLRPQTQVFLLPLALYAAWNLSWRERLVGAGVLVAIDLAWFLPLTYLSGGMARYFATLGQFYQRFNTSTSVLNGAGWSGLVRNAEKLVLYTAYGCSFSALPAAVFTAMVLRRPWQSFPAMLRQERFMIVALWMAPALAYYLFIHMGGHGLVFVFLPGVLLWAAAAVEHLPEIGLVSRPLVAAAIVLGNSMIFLSMPTFPFGGERVKLLTAATLRQHDAVYRPRIEAVRERFAPSHTIILSSTWRYPQYYLPAYELVRYPVAPRWDAREGQPLQRGETWIDAGRLGLVPDDGGSYDVVLFDDVLVPLDASRERQEWMGLPGGQRLAYVRMRAGERLRLGPVSFGIVRAPTGADAEP